MTYLHKRKPGSVATAGLDVVATGEYPAAMSRDYLLCTIFVSAILPLEWQTMHCSLVAVALGESLAVAN